MVCPDRRGVGLNKQAPGDAPSVEALVADVLAVTTHFERPNVPRHLAGFCWGANYAISVLHAHGAAFRSLVLLAPGVFSLPALTDRRFVTGESAVATEEPVVPLDHFTRGPRYRDYVLPDPLRTRLVSPRFNAVLAGMNQKAAPLWARLRLPTLMVLASDDRVSDNAKLTRAFAVLRAAPKRQCVVESEHGVQFDAPDEAAEIITEWLTNFESVS